jgi:dihydropteroate synthase
MKKVNAKKIIQARVKKGDTLVMGILNTTPDSFSDGGLYFNNINVAIEHASQMIAEGADIIDVGGESTRPGAKPVNALEETERVVPVIKALKKKFGKKILLSIDTNKGEVAKAAIKAGADIVNSLGGFHFDQSLADVVSESGVPVVIYHIKGEPQTMQKTAVKYKNVVAEISRFFKDQIAIGKKCGVLKDQYILDPGIGFGKSVEHNLKIVKEFASFKGFKLPLLVGVSRKSHLGEVLKKKLSLVTLPHERIEAGLAGACVAVLGGASIVRTHDVGATKRFFAVLDTLRNIK